MASWNRRDRYSAYVADACRLSQYTTRDPGRDGEAVVVGHLPALVPGDGALQLFGQGPDRHAQRALDLDGAPAVGEVSSGTKRAVRSTSVPTELWLNGALRHQVSLQGLGRLATHWARAWPRWAL